MKTLFKSLLILTVAATTVAFTTPIKKKIDITQSKIEWKGKKVLGSHTGTIALQSGYFEMDGNQLTGGMFVVDMSSITVTDLSGEDKGKLEGHLKSNDFFGVAKHPTATLVINRATSNADGYIVAGDITIKGVTVPIEFDLDMGADFASTSLKIDRTKFGVRYGSGSLFDNLGDNAIADNFELNVTLKF
jgi:polyisoprenoid-binding protein YceI